MMTYTVTPRFTMGQAKLCRRQHPAATTSLSIQVYEYTSSTEPPSKAPGQVPWTGGVKPRRLDLVMMG